MIQQYFNRFQELATHAAIVGSALIKGIAAAGSDFVLATANVRKLATEIAKGVHN